MDIRYDPGDPADLWENITPVTPAEFMASHECPATLPVGMGQLTCALLPGHETPYHWDPRGVEWRPEPGVQPLLGLSDADLGAFDSAPGHG